MVEIMCPAVEVRLEQYRNLPALIELSDGAYALGYFGWVMGIVAQKYGLITLQFEVEAPLHSLELAHALSDFLVGSSTEVG